MLIVIFLAVGRADADVIESRVWQPFESEMDWRVASWAINEEAHNGAVDRLLSIPGVCILVLYPKIGR